MAGLGRRATSSIRLYLLHQRKIQSHHLLTRHHLMQSYISSTLLDTFIEDIPKVTQKHVDDLCEKDEWKTFIGSCTGGKKSNSSTHKLSSDSNEEEFKAVIQCIANLDGLGEYFRKPKANNPRRGHIRISHQRNSLMKTWNTEARWLKGNYGSTARQKESKPDLMTIVVEDAESQRPRETQPKFVRLAKPQTILPPPNNWKPAPMDDKCFPIVECREPVWECLDVLWECKRNSQDLKNAKVYIDCALKAAEALRYQWSRRYVYCFLHCGSIMRLLHFDRSGLMASKPLDIEIDTAKFIQCLLGAFYHKPSRLGYPAGKEAPFHKYDPDDRLFQVVTVDGRQLYIDDQVAGPSRDHLVSRATVAFKANLVNPKEKEKTGWDWCYKSSWPQELRKHEGHYLSSLQDQPNIVELLAYGVVKVENENDTTVFGRQCSSGQPMILLETFYDRAKVQGLNFTQHTGSATSASEDPTALLYDPRRPEGRSQQDCDNREHRDIVTAWAFSAIKVMAERGIVHRDISFTNIRIDNQHILKVCDLDMAASTDDQGTGAQDRTGTVPFMATSLLSKSSAPSTHRPIHDCESIFWLCTIDLLSRVGIGDVKEDLATITNPGAGINLVMSAKVGVIMQLSNFKTKTQRLKAYASLNTLRDSSLFFCLTELMREFVGNDWINDYEGAEEGTENVCFDRCIEIIKRALDSGIEQVTEGIAKTSLSL
ncbi:uncharacterized protein K441DRAFT_63050 [Cenococcum geophilum 1.58]|uniref:uncharacterized protein n=1 Tax=Cenococcum geophilum 1.58 TaxID=794803 RepID=UPI00358FA4A9|nr:hypothetical protein K441DRAFT_63050 [Cenococcum geophilum 1.58]